MRLRTLEGFEAPYKALEGLIRHFPYGDLDASRVRTLRENLGAHRGAFKGLLRPSEAYKDITGLMRRLSPEGLISPLKAF